jgi:hypothetical protein
MFIHRLSGELWPHPMVNDDEPTAVIEIPSSDTDRYG